MSKGMYSEIHQGFTTKLNSWFILAQNAGINILVAIAYNTGNTMAVHVPFKEESGF